GEHVWQVAWAPGGKTLAALSIVGGEVKLWDVAARKERATLRGELGDSYGMAFTPDGKTLAVGHWRNEAKAGPTGGISLWDVATGQRRGLLQHQPPRGVARLVPGHDSTTIAALESWKEGPKGASKHCITLWDVAGGKVLTSWPEDVNGVLALSPDGKVL